MGNASYNSKNVRTSQGWSGFQSITTGNVRPYVNAAGNFLQLHVSITRENSDEYISKMEVSYELFTFSGVAYNITPYILVKADSAFTGNTASELYGEATTVLNASPVTVTTGGTGDISFTLDFNSSPLDFINKPQHGIYLLIATSSTATDVATCTYNGAYGSFSGPGIDVDFAGSLGTYTVRCYTDWDTEAISTYDINVGTNFQIPDGPTRSDEVTSSYLLYPKANGGSLPSGITDGKYEVKNTYSFINWLCQEDNKTYNPGAIYTQQIDTHFIAQWSTTSVKDITAPYSSNGNPTKTNVVNTYKNIKYNLNYTGQSDVLLDQSYTDTISYSFKGWYTTSTGNTRIQDATFTENSDVYAQYSESSHTRTSVQFPYPSRTGFKILGYSNSPTSTTILVSPGGYYTPKDNNGITLYAVWESTTVNISVTFDPHGGTIQPDGFSPHEYEVGEKYNPLPTCTRTDDYDFEGWYDSVSGGNQVTTSTDVTTSSPTELHAHWLRYITTTFDSNGGNTPSFTSHKYRYTEYYNPLPTCTRSGYTFIGWYTDPTNGTRVYTSTQVSSNTSYTTLYAHWSQDITSISATFIVDGAEYEVRSYSYPGTYDPLPAIPDKEGYNKVGWFTSQSGGTQITTSTSTENSDKTFYARYTVISVTVTFNPNGGSVSPTSNTFTYGSTYGTLPTPTLSGSSFVGWFTSASGGTKINSNDTVTYTSNVTFYAHWINTYNYRLSFNINGGEGTVPSAITASDITETSYKATWDLSSVNITTSGWKGWATSSTATTTLPGGTELTEYTLTYDSSIDTTGTVNRTLYAIYDDPVLDTTSVRIYNGSSFVKATPYLYYNGKWNKATAYVYSNGWKKGV